ncbi:hypothetical protein GCM10009836_44090 [Pseudonocardia ailaonensis]|uniref:Luciferase-like domain-containing protein n=1 Tax=Pseudonocardia ailaonensis TaxID=367279 RepID=A0ABN2N9I8_9PSEU
MTARGRRLRLELQSDLQIPEFARVDRPTQYRCALDQARWADQVGFDAINLPEHHCAEDGYLPAPLILAAAVAAVTSAARIRTALIAPLYEPVRLAEEIAVVDHLSDGRLVPVLIPGYRQAEFESLGKVLEERFAAVGDVLAVLRSAVHGAPFQFRGRTVHVTPAPSARLPLLLGGGGTRTAERAATLADGFRPTTAAAWEAYRRARLAAGHEDPGGWLARGPAFLHVAEDPGDAWGRVGPHLLHYATQYDRWIRDELGVTSGGPGSTYVNGPTSIGELKASPAYRVVTPAQCVELVQSLPDGAVLSLHPQMGGIHPDDAWSSLRLFEERVLPSIEPMQGGPFRPN